ncbi:LysR family transcriptional regulator [Orrella sp. JC864]|uniref:LysR family transcriptional regulator n=1 Tax=Orrella sp. JC864 TaxID=3120298 RepID=UPI0012BC6462
MIREFRTFAAVARMGSFTAAGQALGLTQSAVSAQIRRLEAFLGMDLFDRTARSSELNAAGRDMLVQVEQVLAQVDRMVSHAGLGQVSGTLRIGAIASIQQGLLVRALKRMRAGQPEVRVRIVPGVSLGLLAQAGSGEVDLAVMIKPPFALPPELGWRTLLREPIVLLAPAGTPLRPWREMAASQPFIRYEKASFGGRVVDNLLRKHNVAVRDVIELDEIEAIANMVREGLGVALLPLTAGTDLQGLAVVPIDDDDAEREIGIAARMPYAANRAAQAMAECLLAEAGQPPAAPGRRAAAVKEPGRGRSAP